MFVNFAIRTQKRKKSHLVLDLHLAHPPSASYDRVLIWLVLDLDLPQRHEFSSTVSVQNPTVAVMLTMVLRDMATRAVAGKWMELGERLSVRRGPCTGRRAARRAWWRHRPPRARELDEDGPAARDSVEVGDDVQVGLE
jgi:hypothetical protein